MILKKFTNKLEFKSTKTLSFKLKKVLKIQAYSFLCFLKSKALIKISKNP